MRLSSHSKVRQMLLFTPAANEMEGKSPLSRDVSCQIPAEEGDICATPSESTYYKKRFWMERAMRGVRTKMMETGKDRRRQKQNVRAGAAEGVKIFVQVEK